MSTIIVPNLSVIVRLKGEKVNFPGGTVIKNPPADAGDTGLSPGLGRSHMPQEQLSPCATTTEPACHNY